MLQYLLLGTIVLLSLSETQMDSDYQKRTFSARYIINQKPKKSEFLKHFVLLDSAARANPYDTIYGCCKASIDFMVRSTKIEVSTDANITGRLSFSKSDLERWHAWFDKKCRKK